MSGWLLDYSYKCQPVDYSHNPTALRVCDRDQRSFNKAKMCLLTFRTNIDLKLHRIKYIYTNNFLIYFSDGKPVLVVLHIQTNRVC